MPFPSRPHDAKPAAGRVFVGHAGVTTFRHVSLSQRHKMRVGSGRPRAQILHGGAVLFWGNPVRKCCDGFQKFCHIFPPKWSDSVGFVGTLLELGKGAGHFASGAAWVQTKDGQARHVRLFQFRFVFSSPNTIVILLADLHCWILIRHFPTISAEAKNARKTYIFGCDFSKPLGGRKFWISGAFLVLAPLA